MAIRYFKPVTPAEWQTFHRAAVTGNLSLFDFGEFFRATHTARNGRNLSEDECMTYLVGYAAISSQTLNPGYGLPRRSLICIWNWIASF